MSISEFQELMRNIYYHRDVRRGEDRTYLWLLEEVVELGRAIRRNERENVEKEFGDVLAWLCSLANVLSVSLEKVALKKYDGKCPRCGMIPCTCEES